MGYDWVAAVHDAGVVPPLVEQAQVQPEDGSVEDVPVDRAFVGGDDHHVLPVDAQGLVLLQQGLENLVAGHHAFKSGGRNRVLHPGVMRVERHDVADAHVFEFLQRHGAVQALAG